MLAGRTNASAPTRVGMASGAVHDPSLALAFAKYARFLLSYGFVGPRHAGSVMRDTDVAFTIEDDDAAVAIDALLQIVHCLLCGPLGQVSGGNAVGGPLG